MPCYLDVFLRNSGLKKLHRSRFVLCLKNAFNAIPLFGNKYYNYRLMRTFCYKIISRFIPIDQFLKGIQIERRYRGDSKINDYLATLGR